MKYYYQKLSGDREIGLEYINWEELLKLEMVF